MMFCGKFAGGCFVGAAAVDVEVIGWQLGAVEQLERGEEFQNALLARKTGMPNHTERFVFAELARAYFNLAQIVGETVGQCCEGLNDAVVLEFFAEMLRRRYDKIRIIGVVDHESPHFGFSKGVG